MALALANLLETILELEDEPRNLELASQRLANTCDFRLERSLEALFQRLLFFAAADASKNLCGGFSVVSIGCGV